jgi:hypothetical protein
MEMLRVKRAEPVLLSVTFFTVLVVFTTWRPNERLVDERFTFCAEAEDQTQRMIAIWIIALSLVLKARGDLMCLPPLTHQRSQPVDAYETD